MPTIRSVLTCIAAYTIAGFTVIEICFYAVLCTPFNQYWALPVQNQQCATYTTYYQIYMIFNLSSDTLIMAVASSIVYHSRLPLKQRILLMGLFCMGIFTEVAATLSK